MSNPRFKYVDPREPQRKRGLDLIEAAKTRTLTAAEAQEVAETLNNFFVLIER